MTRITISQADLTGNVQSTLERVRQGTVVMVEEGGQEQLVLLDSLDFRLLCALAQGAIPEEERVAEKPDPAIEVLRAYLAKEISLGKSAELLGLSRFDLQARCLRLGIPLRLGPSTLEESQQEIAIALNADKGAERDGPTGPTRDGSRTIESPRLFRREQAILFEKEVVEDS